MSSKCPKCGSGEVYETPVLTIYDCDSRMISNSQHLEQASECKHRVLERDMLEACELLRQSLRIIPYGPTYLDIVRFMEMRSKREQAVDS